MGKNTKNWDAQLIRKATNLYCQVGSEFLVCLSIFSGCMKGKVSVTSGSLVYGRFCDFNSKYHAFSLVMFYQSVKSASPTQKSEVRRLMCKLCKSNRFRHYLTRTIAPIVKPNLRVEVIENLTWMQRVYKSC